MVVMHAQKSVLELLFLEIREFLFATTDQCRYELSTSKTISIAKQFVAGLRASS